MNRFIGFHTPEGGEIYINIGNVVAFGISDDCEGMVWMRTVNGGLVYVSDTVDEIKKAINRR